MAANAGIDQSKGAMSGYLIPDKSVHVAMQWFGSKYLTYPVKLIDCVLNYVLSNLTVTNK